MEHTENIDVAVRFNEIGDPMKRTGVPHGLDNNPCRVIVGEASFVDPADKRVALSTMNVKH